jgi:hypothetical protein
MLGYYLLPKFGFGMIWGGLPMFWQVFFGLVVYRHGIFAQGVVVAHRLAPRTNCRPGTEVAPWAPWAPWAGGEVQRAATYPEPDCLTHP